MYMETIIKPTGNYPIVWQSVEDGEKWEFEEDLLAAMYQSVEMFELGVDSLPEGIEDIRGTIGREPGRVFGWLCDDEGCPVRYSGVLEV